MREKTDGGGAAPKRYLTFGELAARLHESKDAIRRKYLKTGEIPIFRDSTGGQPKLFEESAVAAFEARKSQQAQKRCLQLAKRSRGGVS